MILKLVGNPKYLAKVEFIVAGVLVELAVAGVFQPGLAFSAMVDEEVVNGQRPSDRELPVATTGNNRLQVLGLLPRRMKVTQPISCAWCH